MNAFEHYVTVNKVGVVSDEFRAGWDAAMEQAARALEAMDVTEVALFAAGEWNTAALTRHLASLHVEAMTTPTEGASQDDRS